MKRLALFLAAPMPVMANFQDGLRVANAGDYATALREWKPLAEEGDAAAQFNLGVMYDNDQGVPQDYMQAHVWPNLAAAAGNKIAIKNRDLTEARMEPSQIAEALQSTGGECPLWRRTIMEITGSDPAMADYLQRIAGYCLTGLLRL
ncbi:MAG: hypothetical protein ACKVGZ_16640 [Alphaproteobacteria bacterium]|jgi:TPR repeat protein